MTQVLESYVGGRWQAGSGARHTLVNPATEEVLAETHAGGIDASAALDYARRVGGPALRQLTLVQRGQLLAGMANALHAAREEVLALAISNGGNTRGDAKFDVDGAIGTLSYYAKLASRLPGGDVTGDVFDGEWEGLTRSTRLVGSHLWVPRQGVAVHINAFNFPAWGLAEKAAQALLAGMPVVTRPATSTALAAERMARIFSAHNLLPEGAFSFLACGHAGLVEALGPQDVLAFTGSSDTGTRLRAMPAFQTGARINVEADSLNAAVLGPDVDSSSNLYGLFLDELAHEMTQKAGQKCTATRRIIVPAEQCERVQRDLADLLNEERIGNPQADGVTMGPVSSAAALRDVRGNLDRLLRECRAVFGDGGRGTPVGVEGERGFFITPTLLLAASAESQAPHTYEAFGPVATLIPYNGTAAMAASLVRRGGGGLVCSVYTNDGELATQMLHGVGAYHGRIHFANDKLIEHSPGPGTVMPGLVHGGPGRSGGGEELGGKRGLGLYMQRVAVQGVSIFLEKVCKKYPLPKAS